MQTSADIRRINKNKIRHILQKGGTYTKQQVATDTGLSVATCNTLLNDMQQSGEVIGEKARLQEVGRSTVLYQINEAYESILCITFDWLNGKRILRYSILSFLGRVLEEKVQEYEHLDYSLIENLVANLVKQRGNISQIMIGTPSIAEHGIIRHCDIPELEEVAIVKKLMDKFNIPVHLENDMHFKAYGFYKKQGMPNNVVTLATFPEHVLPGTASVHGGTIIKGTNQFAGMVGFLPYGISRQEEIALLKKPEATPIIEKAIISIIVIINPDSIIFTGDLIDEDVLAVIRKHCLENIPEEYMPEFFFKEDMYGYYLEGMYQRALDIKEVY